MIRREMRLTKQHHDDRLRMPSPNLRDLVRGVAVASPDLAQVLSRHAIEAIDRLTMFASCHQQFIERCPGVTPVQIKTNALPELRFVNFTPPPFFDNVLVAGEDRFQAQHDGTVSRLCPQFERRCRKALRSRKRMIITDQNGVRSAHLGFQLRCGKYSFVCPKGLAELAQIFSAITGIFGTNIALHADQRMQLRRASPRSEVRGRRHQIFPLLDFLSPGSLCSKFARSRSLPNFPPQTLTVATTGASGSIFFKHFLSIVERDARVKKVNFIASDSGLRVIAEELG